MRKLVTVRQIAALDPIPNADAIECATVDGWKVVVKKNEYEAGQYVLYFEIDSILPEGRPEFDFLMARGVKDLTTEEPGVRVRGHRLRTIKLRGQVSQGLVIPLPPEWAIVQDKDVIYVETFWQEDAFELDSDFSKIFDVVKYERPISPQMQGKQRGAYPGWMPKTDQERVQNCFRNVENTAEPWIIEEKVEGSSITIYWNETLGVTSRNIDLVLDQEGNTFVDTAHASGLLDWLEDHAEISGQPVALRGELVGPGIQDNIYGLNDFRIYIYDIFLPKDGGYVNPQMRRLIMRMILESPMVDPEIVFSIPVVQEVAFTDETTVDDIVLSADGMSKINPNVLREGIVYKTFAEPVDSFKAISNKYLLKEKE